jgi:hypothetical protein
MNEVRNMIIWLKRIMFLLSLCWAAFYAYEAWTVAELFHISWRMFAFSDYRLAITVGLGPLAIASILFAVNWPSKAE